MSLKDKQCVFLGVVAVVLVIVSVIGLEDRIFPNRVDINQLKKPYVAASVGGLAVGATLKDKLVQSWNHTYVVAKRILDDSKGLVDRKSVATTDDDDLGFVTLRVMGIMRGANGDCQAIINRSLVSTGGMVSGCQVVRIGSDFVELDAHGTLETLHLNEECRFRRRAFTELNLEDLVMQGNVWRAKINGYMYRAGDEIDSETQVRAVTPNEVLVMRAGTMMALKMGQ